MDKRIRVILAEHGRFAGDVGAIGDDDDLFAAGMTSHASVSVMLALEDEFDLEFPDEMLNRSVFSTIRSIVEAVEGLQQAVS